MVNAYWSNQVMNQNVIDIQNSAAFLEGQPQMGQLEPQYQLSELEQLDKYDAKSKSELEEPRNQEMYQQLVDRHADIAGEIQYMQPPQQFELKFHDDIKHRTEETPIVKYSQQDENKFSGPTKPVTISKWLVPAGQ